MSYIVFLISVPQSVWQWCHSMEPTGKFSDFKNMNLFNIFWSIDDFTMSVRRILLNLRSMVKIEFGMPHYIVRGALFIHQLQMGRIMVWWCPSGSPSVHTVSVRPFSALFSYRSCSDILSWNFAHDFVLMYYRSKWSVITLRQFLKELCLLVNLEYRKYLVFCTFLLHALTYWAEILHMTLFWCTTEQAWVSSLCVNFWRSYASFGT